MKIKFRTVLLVFLFIQLCIFFTVLQETIESLSSNDHPLIYGTRDIYYFDLLLIIVCSISIVTSLLLIVLSAVGHNRFRKPYLIIAFSINLILITPFFLSGVYFSFHDRQSMSMSPKMNTSFGKIHQFVAKYRRLNSTLPANSTKPNVTIPLNTDMINAYDFVTHIQKRYCCCGLNGAAYYGFVNKTNALKEKIPLTSKKEIRCPLYSEFKNSSCIDSHLHGCKTRIFTVYPTRILLYSCIGTVFSVLFIFLAPFFYSQFELDRRCARSKYIREWRRAIEQHVIDHRMWALGQAKCQSSENQEQLTLSPAPTTEESARGTETRSTS